MEEMTISSLLTSSLIASWCATSKAPSACDDSETVRQDAATIWGLLKSGERVATPLNLQVTVPDLGWALRELVEGDFLAPPELRLLKAASAAFTLLQELEWPASEIDERAEILSDIAYWVSVRCRHEHRYDQMRDWEDRCVSLALHVEPDATFLRSRTDNGPSRVDAAFLRRAPILLAVCRQLEKDRNHAPLKAKGDSLAAYVATELQEHISAEELNYFRGAIAQSAGIALCHIGDFEASETWLQKARDHFRVTRFPEALLVAVRVADLVKTSALHRWNEVLLCVDEVQRQAASYGMHQQVLSLRLLRAHCLKDAGRLGDALEQFIALDTERVFADPLNQAITLIGMADAQGSLGDTRGAIESCSRAMELIPQCNAPLAWGFVHGVLGQILRDSGRTDEAALQFDRSAEAYAAGGMVQLQCYTLIVLSELLLGSGRCEDGLQCLSSAFSILRSTRVDAEITAAVELLRFAMSNGSYPSHQTVRRFREQFENRIQRK